MGTAPKVRLDALLVNLGFVQTRSKARDAVLQGIVTVNGSIAGVNNYATVSLGPSAFTTAFPGAPFQITEVVDELDAVGGTNIYGALEAAFAMAGVKEGKEWTEPLVDTIFLLSDGKPSIGISTDPEARRMMLFVKSGR